MPSETIIVPIYILFSRLGILGTYIPIIIPCFLGFGLRGALFVFVFNQFFLSLPKALEEAAAIDGAGPIRTFFSIALPNAKASTLITLVLGVVWHWNDTYEPSMFIELQKNWLLPQMLPNIYQHISSDVTVESLMNNSAVLYNEAVAMAATTLVIVPLIVFYMLVQSKFMVSVERSGITG
jgi:multiple sugar transport system permease protein